MKVSISEAARMAGVTRATFYRHKDSKGITVEEDNDGNPQVDVSELIRVYGDKIRVDTEDQGSDSGDTAEIKQPIQGDTPAMIQVELAVLREKVQYLEADRKKSAEEREREREQLLEQIENFRKALDNSQEQQKRLSLMITDQREGQGKRVEDQDNKFKSIEETMEKLAKQNKILNHKLKQQEVARRKAEEDARKAAAEKQEEIEKNRSIWQKMFG